ncbi:MAG: SpoVR family protein, partial [Gemmatimonadetes bacterium]|nr:SpoVR family protein [Gemmatimonadota bacterium]
VLLFLMHYAPLRDWERDVLSMIREESYYFAPQAQTKIMNEGWATFWHSKIMTEYCLKDAEIIDYADHHSGTVATQQGQLNPYKMGLDLFRDIEYRWDTGRFGEEYEACDDLTAKREWNRNLGQGLEKIYEVRKIHNDVTFIDTFLTEEFCREHKLFVFAYNEKKARNEVATREFAKVKQQLLFQLTNVGRPFIFVEDANFGNRGELLLAHRHEGLDLDDGMAKKTLINIQRFWRRPVRLRSIRGGKGILYSFDGKEMAEEEADQNPQPEIFEELS